MKQWILREWMDRVIGIVDAFHDVPTKDATTDVVMSDVVGKKDDTAVTSVGTTKTIIAYVKGVLTTALAIKPYTTTGVIVEDTSDGTPKIITVASHGDANTLGSWVTIDTSVSADSYICAITVLPDPVAVADRKFIIEVGTGASPATKIRFSAIYQYDTDIAGVKYSFVYTIPIPIKVASGTKISVRASDDEAQARNYLVGVQYYQSL